jgi:Leucine-rich repeat (LRR) protein
MDLKLSQFSDNSCTVKKLSFNDTGKNNITYFGDEPFEYGKCETVDFSPMDLYKFPRGLGSIFPVVKKLTIHCKIPRVSRADFTDLEGLEILDMDANLIKDLPGDLFNDERSLQSINFCRNKIVNVEVGLFDALPFLGDMNLENNYDINKKWQYIQQVKIREEMIKEIYSCCKPPPSAASIIGQHSDKAL